MASTFASCPAVGSGAESIYALNDEPGVVVCWAGDGGTYDIGVASLSAAAERNENLIYICYDNEIYGNTGGQRSSATPDCAITSTTPRGKIEPKKDIVGVMAAHGIPYAATLSIAHLADFERKLRYAAGIKGFKFLLMHSPCPTGWKSEPADSIDLVRTAVKCGLFPLYEVFEGRRYRINVEPDGTSPDGYFDRQRRFKLTDRDKEQIVVSIDRQWDHLRRMAEAFPAGEGEGQNDARTESLHL
jgi:pyruvate ferredoxin oxidoreductase beta subunit/2-oxoisovalerate ferredoxin oxidoreductase beta subunit